MQGKLKSKEYDIGESCYLQCPQLAILEVWWDEGKGGWTIPKSKKKTSESSFRGYMISAVSLFWKCVLNFERFIQGKMSLDA